MNIRPYSISDIKIIGKLFDDFISLNKSVSYKQNCRDIYLNWLKNMYDNSDVTVLVVEENNKTIGFAVGMIQKNKPLYLPEKIGNIGMFIIDSNYRRKGIGTILYKELCNWFGLNGVNEIQLTTETNNEIAKSFWRSFGFDTAFEQRLKKI